ncbi:MAG: hypothetical protein PHI12_08640 [Dehalococcoidales bacterium]|nr:hypothetical protein [Dehalococcoidales bacterium]
MKTVFIKFDRGTWYIQEADNEYHIYYRQTGGQPQLMIICKGKDVFSTLAECCSLMYGQIHPEVNWSDNLTKEIEGLL